MRVEPGNSDARQCQSETEPGLMRQHATALEAACAIGGAECSGLTVGASELTFRPGSVTPARGVAAALA